MRPSQQHEHLIHAGLHLKALQHQLTHGHGVQQCLLEVNRPVNSNFFKFLSPRFSKCVFYDDKYYVPHVGVSPDISLKYKSKLQPVISLRILYIISAVIKLILSPGLQTVRSSGHNHMGHVIVCDDDWFFKPGEKVSCFPAQIFEFVADLANLACVQLVTAVSWWAPIFCAAVSHSLGPSV